MRWRRRFPDAGSSRKAAEAPRPKLLSDDVHLRMAHLVVQGIQGPQQAWYHSNGRINMDGWRLFRNRLPSATRQLPEFRPIGLPVRPRAKVLELSQYPPYTPSSRSRFSASRSATGEPRRNV